MNTPTPKLWELTRQWVDELEELYADGEPSQEQIDVLLDSGVSADIKAKIERCALMVRTLKSNAEAIKVHAKSYADRARALESQAENLRAYIARNMERANFGDVTTDTVRVHLVEPRESVVVDDPDMLPGDLVSYTPKPDKKAIAARLNAGEKIPGARMQIGEYSVRITE